MKMQEEKVSENVRKEMLMTTELLAEAGVDEPMTLKMMKTKTFLVFYLLFSLMANLMTAFAVDPRTRLIYLGKTALNASGLYSIHKRSLNGFSAFAVCFGVATLLWSVPVMAGLLVLFSKDVCSVLAGASPSNPGDFLNYCRNNLTLIRLAGSTFLASEVLLDAFVLVQIVSYQRFLKTVACERSVLQKYHGKERISLP